jgi:cell division protein FtsA
VSKGTVRNSVIAALDVGTTKVCCFVATTDDNGHLQISGVGHHRANGMRNGQVVNMDAAEASVRAAVDAAEQMANERIDRVFVNVTCGSPRSSQVEVEMAVSGHQIRDADVRKIMEQAGGDIDTGDRELIHCIPTGYTATVSASTFTWLPRRSAKAATCQPSLNGATSKSKTKWYPRTRPVWRAWSKMKKNLA